MNSIDFTHYENGLSDGVLRGRIHSARARLTLAGPTCANRPAIARPNVRRARAAAAGRSVARVTRFAVGNGRLGRLKRGHAMWGSAADYLKKAS